MATTKDARDARQTAGALRPLVRRLGFGLLIL
jgi:hypothetical protein